MQIIQSVCWLQKGKRQVQSHGCLAVQCVLWGWVCLWYCKYQICSNVHPVSPCTCIHWAGYPSDHQQGLIWADNSISLISLTLLKWLSGDFCFVIHPPSAEGRKNCSWSEMLSLDTQNENSLFCHITPSYFGQYSQISEIGLLKEVIVQFFFFCRPEETSVGHPERDGVGTDGLSSLSGLPRRSR